VSAASGPGPEEILSAELGAPFREYRRRWGLAREFKGIPPFPLHVDYELMSACNLRCPMCLFAGDGGAASAAGSSRAGTLPVALVKDLISDGAAKGQASMGFGGLWEPLLSPHVAGLVAHGRAQGLVDAMMSTNGLLLTRARSRELVEAGLTRLMVSLDAATPGTYALMRPGSDFGIVTDNVMGFLAERGRAGGRLPLLRLSFLVTEYNEMELPAFLEAWAGKADFFSVQRYGDFGAARPIFPAKPPGPAPSGRCAQPFKRLAVRHDGTVLPCCDLSGIPLALGNVPGVSLAEIWAGKRLAWLRDAVLADVPEGLPRACRECRGKFGPDGSEG
jgi:MoaA/NifB/PqqE/SkfB family radical SAM enzyme